VQGIVDGCVADTCINIIVLDGCQFVFPNIFSPNGDGINDVWCSQSQACIVSQTLTIFDRWGNLVHQTTGSEVCWYGGNNIANNVYTYFLQLQKQDGKEESIAGNITLVR
jgi:gliding motility-associated-like protein